MLLSPFVDRRKAASAFPFLLGCDAIHAVPETGVFAFRIPSLHPPNVLDDGPQSVAGLAVVERRPWLIAAEADEVGGISRLGRGLITRTAGQQRCSYGNQRRACRVW